MGVTLRNFFSTKYTLNYPEERLRSRLVSGVACVCDVIERAGALHPCKLCEAVCPAVCITIDSEVAPDGTRRTSRMTSICSMHLLWLCEEACPVDAIVLTRIHEYHMEHSRGEHHEQGTSARRGRGYEHDRDRQSGRRAYR